MAIDMRAAIGVFYLKWRKLGHDIGFGIGIAHGFATLGTIGFEGDGLIMPLSERYPMSHLGFPTKPSPGKS